MRVRWMPSLCGVSLTTGTTANTETSNPWPTPTLTSRLPVEGLERHFRISLRGRFEVLACLAMQVPRKEGPKHAGNDFKPALWRNLGPVFLH